MMKLETVKARLGLLVTNEIVRALPGEKPEDLLAHGLLAALQTSVRLDRAGRRMAADVYTVVAPEASLARWQGAELRAAIIAVLRTGARDAGVVFERPPTLVYAEDASARAGEFRIVASRGMGHSAERRESRAQPQDAAAPEEAWSLPDSGFLIVDGVKEFRLSRAVVNIGRQLDNDLVVDDPRVSRHHAQLRAIKGRFVLFDLNSSGGTFINGQRASQSILYPGDVLSLAGVSLIFGQDNPLPQRDLSRTAPRSEAGADRRTAIMRAIPGPSKKVP
jgi:hypothetical protein